MLRFFVLALLLLNGLYFAWAQGFLQALGLAPASQAEPQRLALQIKPETLRLLTQQDLRQPEAPPPVVKPPVCLQAGLFDEAQSAQLRSALEPVLPAGSWLLEPALEPARWVVYMGPYPSAEALAKKRAELASLKLNFEPISDPALQGGLSLGGYETQAAATAGLNALSRRGVRTARVLQERAELGGMLLRLPAADDSLRARLDEVKSALAGKLLEPCR